MFNPSRDQVRAFFCEAWRKHRSGELLTGIEPVAVDIISLHPEYHPLLADPAASVPLEFKPEDGKMNPFLHLSLHLAIAEQLAIDQPAGIRKEVRRLVNTHGDEHKALHAALECLGEAVWRAQREGRSMDGEAYLESLRRA